MITRSRGIAAAVFVVTVPALIVAGRAQAPAPASAQRLQTQGPSDEGIPVTDPVVVRACGSCHTRDDKQRMTRISDRRATPENWELTIRRMMSLNNVQLTPDVARAVIKSLADSHGLSPEEARPIQFEAERRLIDFAYEGDKDTNTLCSRCHSIGRVLSERHAILDQLSERLLDKEVIEGDELRALLGPTPPKAPDTIPPVIPDESISTSS